MTACPDEDDLMRFAQGMIDPPTERHVDACDLCRTAVAMLASMHADSAEDEAPSLLAGRFELGEPLGSGGLGLVVAAHDTRLGVDVAIKLLRPDRPVSLERLDDEVRTAREVRHPNVCAVFDLGQDDGRRFITMERVDGQPLDAWVDHARPDAARRRQILSQIVDGVAAAHARHVVHRDLKPGNVMIDGDGQAKVMDFGLAVDSRTDHWGGRVGTPTWWAPEQERGEPVTTRSDVFAIGALAHWLEPDARGRFRRWIETCRAENPADRFADAIAARRALSTRSRRSRWWALTACVAALGFAGWWSTRPATPIAPPAPKPAAMAEFQRGHQHLLQFNIDHALPGLTEATRLDPSFAQAHLWLGYAYHWFGDAPRARRAVDEAMLHMDRLRDHDRLFLLALEANLRHDRGRTRVLLDRLIARHPDHCAAALTRADIDFHDGHFSDAAEVFDHFVTTEKGPPQAWQHLMWARFATGGIDPALAVLDRWAQVSPDQRVTRQRMNVLMAAGRRAQALDAIETVLTRTPDQMGAMLFTALLELEDGDAAAAHAIMEALIARTPERQIKMRGKLWRRLMWLKLAEGDLVGAEEAGRRARATLRAVHEKLGGAVANVLTDIEAEQAWARAVWRRPFDDASPSLASLAASADIHASRYASIAVALACLTVDDRPCTEAVAHSGWPMVRTIERAHRHVETGDLAQAAALLRVGARRTSPQHQPALWLAAGFLAEAAGDTGAAADDLRAASRYLFATPYSVVARAKARRLAVR